MNLMLRVQLSDVPAETLTSGATAAERMPCIEYSGALRMVTGARSTQGLPRACWCRPLPQSTCPGTRSAVRWKLKKKLLRAPTPRRAPLGGDNGKRPNVHRTAAKR